MRPIKMAVSIVLGIALGIPFFGSAAEDFSTKPSALGVETQIKTSPDFNLPVYMRPKNAKLGGRVDGNSRGDEGKLPAVFLLAPLDHTGLTTHAQPTLYWFLSKLTTSPIEIVFDRDLRESPARYDPRQSQPILVRPISSPREPGVQRISLKELGLTLEPEVRYIWHIRVVLNPEGPTPDIVATAPIERVSLVEALQIHLSYPGPRDVLLLAKAGLWYDAISAISEAIEKTPSDGSLRRQRAALLKQAGLPEVAKYDYPE